MRAEELLAALTCGRGGCACAQSLHRGKGLTHCPAHADSTPSLNVDVGRDGVALVRCHGGCSNDEVIEVLRSRGMWGAVENQPRDGGNSATGRIVATYDYTDENGELLFQVVRFEPKSFRQRRPDGKGGWDWRVRDVRRVLYRLPEVIRAVQANDLVVVVEGEKDADSLAALGFVATTSPGGAGKWNDAYAIPLVGASVVVIADKDDADARYAGQKHAKQVADCVALVAKSTKLIELTGQHVKDASDWLATKAGENKTLLRADLMAIIDAAPEWRAPQERKLITARDAAGRYWDIIEKRVTGDPDYAGITPDLGDLDKYLAYRPGEVWLIVAQTGIGKTALLMTMQSRLDAHGVASLFASVEQPLEQLMDRIVSPMVNIDSWKLARGKINEAELSAVNQALGRVVQRPSVFLDEPLLETGELDLLVRLAKVKYGVRVVFVDYAQRLADRNAESEYVRVTNISHALARIARELRVCVVAAAQVSRRAGRREDGTPPDLEDIRDSGYLEQDAGVVLSIGRARQEPAKAVVVIQKNRNGISKISVPMSFDAERVRFIP